MKYVLGILVLGVLGLGYFLFKTNKELEDCKKVPDFRNAISESTKFVGFEKSFHFTLVCKKKQEFEECMEKKVEVVSPGETVVLKPIYDRSVLGSKFVVDWVEKTNFYLDLSNPEKWDVKLEEKKIIFNAPKIEIEQIINHNSYLAYVADRRIWADDEDILLDISLKAPLFSAKKTGQYLVEHLEEIEIMMESRIESFILKIIGDLGYEQGFDVEVVFEESEAAA